VADSGRLDLGAVVVKEVMNRGEFKLHVYMKYCR
jgi:hypothetical protein